MQVVAGETVEQILKRVQPDDFLRRDAYVMHGGIEIPREYWSRVRPKPGHQLDVIITLQRGGGNKNPLRTIMSIALLAAGAIWGPALGTALVGAGGAFGISAAAIGSAVITFGGNLALSAIIPPQQPKIGRLSGTNSADRSQHFAIEGARNQERQWQKIPRVYGRHRLYADKGAKEYTEIEGDDQYMRGLYVWGYGPLSLSNSRIGETAIEEFEGVEIEHREGWPDDAPLTLFTNDVTEENLSIQLEKTAGWQTRTTQPGIDEISIDVAFSNGLVQFDDQGNRLKRTVDFEVQYAPTGTSDWVGTSDGVAIGQQNLTVTRPRIMNITGLVVPSQYYVRAVVNKYNGKASLVYGSAVRQDATAKKPGVPSWGVSVATVLVRSDTAAITGGMITDDRTAASPNRGAAGQFAVTAPGAMVVRVAAGTIYFSGLTVTEKRPGQFSRSLRFPVERGQYDVRIRRLSADTDNDRIFDDTYWTKLRSIRHEYPVNFDKPLAMTAIRIKASGQLNSLIDQLNCDGHSILRVYDADNDNWDKKEPTSNPGAIGRDVLQGAATKKPLPDGELHLGSFEDCYEHCAERGYAYNSVIDYQTSVGGLLDEVLAAGRAFHHRPDGRVTIGIERAKDTPSQHFTPANTWEFSGDISFPDLPQGVRVRFSNELEGYRSDMRTVFIDGYDENNATEYGEMEKPGITHPDLIWQHTRYDLAIAYNRREKFSFWSDFESLQSVRGDMALFSHDVPRFGLGYGRLSAVTDNGTHITSVTLDTPVVMETGESYVVRIVLDDSVSLLAAVETDDDPDGVLTLTLAEPVAIADGPRAGNHYMFGRTEQECIQVLIRNIETGRNNTMRITCQPYAPVVYEADQGEAPAWNSALSATQTIGQPTIQSVRSDGSVLLRDPDGSLTNRILISFARPSSLFKGLRTVQARFREADSNAPWVIVSVDVDQAEIGLAPVEAGVEYEFQLRWIGAGDRVGEWTPLAAHVCIGKEARPADVIRFSGQQNGSVCLFRWGQIPDLDAAGYDIRYIESTTPLTGDDLWNNMTILKEVERGDELTSAALPPGLWKVGIKAVDTSGNYSQNAKIITVEMVNAFDIIFQRPSHPRWPGVKTDCLVHEVSGRLVSADLAPAGGDDFDVFDHYRIDAPDGFMYEAAEFDVGFDYTNMRIWAERMTALGPDESGVVLTHLEVAAARDGGDFGDFAEWTIGTQSARRIKHRVGVDLTQGLGALVAFTPVVDIEEREDAVIVTSSDAAAVRVAYPVPYARPPLIEITVNSGTPAFAEWANADNTGFDLNIYDNAGNRIIRETTIRTTGV